jgi:enamine deaminase RidA (YjgF/YER057c/UK114 family)
MSISKRTLGRNAGDARPEFSQGIAVTGNQTLIFIAGQVAVSADGQVVASALAPQAEQVFGNLRTLLEQAGAGFEDVVSFTTYLTSEADIANFVTFRREAFPGMFPNRAYPTNTLVVVRALARPEFLIEVSAIAAAPARTEGG